MEDVFVWDRSGR